VQPVLELDVHSAPELVDVKRRRGPVDADLLADRRASSTLKLLRAGAATKGV